MFCRKAFIAIFFFFWNMRMSKQFLCNKWLERRIRNGISLWSSLTRNGNNELGACAWHAYCINEKVKCFHYPPWFAFWFQIHCHLYRFTPMFIQLHVFTVLKFRRTRQHMAQRVYYFVLYIWLFTFLRFFCCCCCHTTLWNAIT